MKKINLLSVFLLFCLASLAQNLILNGSFENNTASGNMSDVTASWASIVANSFQIDGGTMDLITSNTCGTASDGNWFVTCSPQSGTWPYMAFSFKLSTTLTFGAQYTLTFDKRFCGPNSSPIDIGLSNDSTLFGTLVHTFSAPTVNTWTPESYIFQAMLAAKYLTVNVGITGGTGIVGLDNFSLQAGALGITDNSTAQISISPNPSGGIFTVDLPNSRSESRIDVYDGMGQKVYANVLFPQHSTQIDLSSFPSGMYVLTVQDRDNIYIERIVIE